mmetsp:Transcript_33730/g.54123  ORF Transcript_33730/g.54123 Transcript_33730/m.54123 type:complete len:287 (+) Transcript_33730:83-943(+)
MSALVEEDVVAGFEEEFEEEDGRSSSDSSSDGDEGSSGDDDDVGEEKMGLLKGNEAPGWAEYTDEKSGQPYFFNHVTGESQWHRPLSEVSTAQKRKSVVKSWFQKNETAIQPFSSNEYDKLGQSEEEDDDVEDLETQGDVDSAVNYYVLGSLFHVVMFEAPIASLEGIFRGMFQFFVGIGSLLLVLSGHRSFERSRALLRDSFELFFAGLTLLVPFGVMFVYGDFYRAWRDGRLAKSVRVDDWKIQGVPSILGRIDATKLYTIARGQGSYATNVRNRTNSKLAHTS